jgi:lipopolysaccharide transport protein LptA
LRRTAPLAPLTTLLCCLFALQAQAAGPRRSDLPINVDAASSDFDYKNNQLLFREVTITQGDVQVRADQANATGLDFENSEWVFRGNVRIKVDGGSLTSDEARVTFAGNRIARAVITGSPAAFEQLLENGDQARGRAGTIDYDFSGSTVRLREDAYLTDGHNQIRGETLVYRIGDQRVLANAEEQGSERVHITINPRSVEEAQKKKDEEEKAKEPQKPPPGPGAAPDGER